MSEQAASATTHKFQAEVNRVLSLVINSLYSHKEIFVRELVSNAADALDKLRFKALTDVELLRDDPRLRIRLIPDAENKTLTIWDNGIGMTREELQTNLGTVAYSGSQEFLARLEEAQQKKDLELIGQFGVGFYSSYLVADSVEVISKAVGEEQAWRWSSAGHDEYTIEPAERDVRGTSVILHLKEDEGDYLSEWQLRTLVNRYADYVDHPIEMKTTKTVGEGDDATTTEEFEKINEASALWLRSASEIEKEQYHEFYKHLTHDWEEPLAYTHFKIEGSTEFTGILFVPTRRPFDLFDRDSKSGVRLYVKRVFIMEDCQEILPRWLRFMRGMVDSNDLSLNISRELLQDSRLIRVIKKQVVKKSLSLLEELAKDRPEDYLKFWENFGAVFKEGLHMEADLRQRLAGLVRFESSKSKEPTSLADYVERMPEGQPAIYYAMGLSREMLESSPHLEVLKKKDYEVLYLTDGIDQWAISGLTEFQEKKLVSALAADLKLDDDDEQHKAEHEAKQVQLKSLTEHFKSVLGDKVAEVQISDRLAESPVCLVIPEGGLPSHIERMLQQHRQAIPTTKRILELNPEHQLIKHLDSLRDKNTNEQQLGEWIELLYDQALLTEGSPIDNPATFASRVTRLMEKAAFAEVLRV